MFFMPFHERAPISQGQGQAPGDPSRSQLRFTGEWATSLFGVYSVPHTQGAHVPRYARHTQASQGTQPSTSPRPQRTFTGAKGSSFNRTAVMRHMAGEFPYMDEPRKYYRGNVQLVGESYEPLRALR